LHMITIKNKTIIKVLPCWKVDVVGMMIRTQIKDKVNNIKFISLQHRNTF